jgi:hypothetical protein
MAASCRNRVRGYPGGDGPHVCRLPADRDDLLRRRMHRATPPDRPACQQRTGARSTSNPRSHARQKAWLRGRMTRRACRL